MREPADGIEVLHKRQNTFRDGNGPVNAGLRFASANHVIFFQVDVLHLHLYQLGPAHTGIDLNQYNLYQIRIRVQP